MFLPVTEAAEAVPTVPPNCGVSAIVSPTTSLNLLSALPLSFFACSVILYSPGLSDLPLRKPVLGSSFTPSGKPSAENCIGRSPVAATVNSTGWPGRTPKTLGPLMRGVAAGLGVRISSSAEAIESRTKQRSREEDRQRFSYVLEANSGKFVLLLLAVLFIVKRIERHSHRK